MRDSHAWNEYLSVTHDALYVCKMLVFVELTDHHCAPSSIRWELHFSLFSKYINICAM